MRIYLAGPIDRISVLEATEWRSRLIGMSPSGFCFFDPAAAFGASHRKESGAPSSNALEWIDSVNFISLNSCDVMVLRLEDKQPAQMTYTEIGMALAWNIPIVAWADHPAPFLDRICTHRCSNLEEVLATLLRLSFLPEE